MMSIPIRARFRRRPVGLLAATLLACGIATAQAPPEAPPEAASEAAPTTGPRLEVPEDVVDLGQLVRGETGEARFALHNRGDATLRILRAKPG